MENTAVPPPAIGESSKVRTILDILHIAKILALIIAILLLVAAAWYGFTFNIFGAIYSVAAAVINLLLYMRMDEYASMVNNRRYGELRDNILIWAILAIIFGVIVGILLLIVYIELEEIEKNVRYAQNTPNTYRQPPPPPPPP